MLVRLRACNCSSLDETAVHILRTADGDGFFNDESMLRLQSFYRALAGLLDKTFHTVDVNDMVETHVGGPAIAQRGRSGGAGGLGKHVHAFEIGAGRVKTQRFVDYARELVRAGRYSTRGVSGSRGICCMT